MKITLKLNKNETDLFNHFKQEIEMNITKLTNFSTYINLAKKYNNTNNIIINNHKNILQAINYDIDEDNNYWIILTNEFIFLDIMIPAIVDLDNNDLYENLSEQEIEIIKCLKNFIN